MTHLSMAALLSLRDQHRGAKVDRTPAGYVAALARLDGVR